MQKHSYESSRQSTPGSAMQFILLLGLVSALGDITYETGRSISGPYLALLGASATAIGFFSGLGEFIGYAFRLVSGFLVERTRLYWAATFLGYGLILSIPLLAYTDRWQIAVLLLILERIGKAIRSPARDTILSYAASQTGRGWGFAVHEALDQVGAVLGPLLFTIAFMLSGSYPVGLSILWIPAILTLVVLAIARLQVPHPEKFETDSLEKSRENLAQAGYPRVFWFYVLFTFLTVAGFANFQVISYHWVNDSLVPETQIPLFYAVAMGVDALAALVIGKTYDRVGLKSLLIVPLLTLVIPFLAFSQQYWLVLASVVLWGMVMAVQETIMRAGIADLISTRRRASAYGIFNTIYGAAWFVGSAMIGFLYDLKLAWLLAFVVLVEVAALFVYPLLQGKAAKPR